MTETAGAGNITVFKPGYLFPVRSYMAIFAGVAGGHMVGRFALTTQS